MEFQNDVLKFVSLRPQTYIIAHTHIYICIYIYAYIHVEYYQCILHVCVICISLFLRCQSKWLGSNGRCSKLASLNSHLLDSSVVRAAKNIWIEACSLYILESPIYFFGSLWHLGFICMSLFLICPTKWLGSNGRCSKLASFDPYLLESSVVRSTESLKI